MLTCSMPSYPAITASWASMCHGMWPVTVIPRACASLARTGTSSGFTEL